MYKILSMSGGGARGVYQAVFLQTIEKTLGRPLHQRFDLIAGTSTGSIVAAGVAFDIELERIRKLFVEVAPAIFSSRWFSNVRKGPHYSSDALRTCLNDVFEDRKLGDAPTPLLIPATTLNRYSSRQFSTFAEGGVVYRGGRPMVAGPNGAFTTPGQPAVKYIDPHLRVADVVLASCAAPSFFPPVRPDDPEGWADDRSYVDGGMWSNSPSLVAVISAHHYLGIPLREMKVLSIGNGESAQGSQPDDFVRMRPVLKPMITSMFDIMFAAQSKSADELAEMLIGAPQFLRVNSTLQQPISLDDAAESLRLLPPLAAQDAAARLPEIGAFLA